MSEWRLEARTPMGDATYKETESNLRRRAEVMVGVEGWKRYRFHLYEGDNLKATYKRGVWTEHAKEKT